MTPDDTDVEILAALCSDGRADLPAVAERTGVSMATVRDRLRTLEEEGVVRGYAPRIDYEAAGYGPTVLFRLRVPADRLGAVTERLAAEPRLVTVYEVTGRWNVFAMGTFAELDEMDAFTRELVTHADVSAVDASVALDAPREHAPLDPTQG